MYLTRKMVIQSQAAHVDRFESILKGML